MKGVDLQVRDEEQPLLPAVEAEKPVLCVEALFVTSKNMKNGSVTDVTNIHSNQAPTIRKEEVLVPEVTPVRMRYIQYPLSGGIVHKDQEATHNTHVTTVGGY